MLSHGEKETWQDSHQGLVFGMVGCVFNKLCDVLCRRADTANSEEDVVHQEVCSLKTNHTKDTFSMQLKETMWVELNNQWPNQALDFFGESCRKHGSLTTLSAQRKKTI